MFSDSNALKTLERCFRSRTGGLRHGEGLASLAEHRRARAPLDVLLAGFAAPVPDARALDPPPASDRPVRTRCRATDRRPGRAPGAARDGAAPGRGGGRHVQGTMFYFVFPTESSVNSSRPVRLAGLHPVPATGGRSGAGRSLPSCQRSGTPRRGQVKPARTPPGGRCRVFSRRTIRVPGARHGRSCAAPGRPCPDSCRAAW